MRLRVKEIAQRRGIKNASQLSFFTGIPVDTCYRLWSGETEHIGVNTTLERLCDKLQTHPGEIFDFIRDKPADKDGPTLLEVTGRKAGRKKKG